MNNDKKIYSKLENFPIMFFASIMGFSGLTISYILLNRIYEVSDTIFILLKFLTTGLFLVVFIFYVAKFLKYPHEVKKDLVHPIKINFFGAFTISLLLLSIIWHDDKIFYAPFYYLGLITQTALTFYVIVFWIKNPISIKFMNPTAFIPIVGNLIVVIAGDGEYLWYHFSIGIFFWIVLFVIIFYRLIFEEKLMSKFMPTLFIMLAPPAVAFLGIVKLTGEFGTLSYIFLSLT
ncbi:MAG: C4-dicarboxylate ABC transporter, partial [Campylobacter sp.]|nr:C4-dicarboxylate ABC transporter [Campylobacter sp.]